MEIQFLGLLEHHMVQRSKEQIQLVLFLNMCLRRAHLWYIQLSWQTNIGTLLGGTQVSAYRIEGLGVQNCPELKLFRVWLLKAPFGKCRQLSCDGLGQQEWMVMISDFLVHVIGTHVLELLIASRLAI